MGYLHHSIRDITLPNMCGRYQLELDFGPEFRRIRVPRDYRPNRDARPTHLMPIVRLDDQGEWVAELRRWGFLRKWPGPSGKMVKKTLINSVAEEVTTKRSFKQAFATARCLVPMNAWYEWPVIDGQKTRYRIAMKDRPGFGAAGLYELSKDWDTGEPVETYTILTVSPGQNTPLAGVHDRAPLILQAKDYDAWLDPNNQLAQALIEPYSDQQAFYFEQVSRAEELKL